MFSTPENLANKTMFIRNRGKARSFPAGRHSNGFVKGLAYVQQVRNGIGRNWPESIKSETMEQIEMQLDCVSLRENAKCKLKTQSNAMAAISAMRNARINYN